ncbi:MAG: hypothetical protein ACYTBJ_21795, partial [Planctomycetota bacterium]
MAAELPPGFTLDPPQSGGAKDFGLREDGTRKGSGFLGEIPTPSGDVMTELSIGVNFDGKERLIPLIVPTLTREEISALASGAEPTREMVGKAVQHARQRISSGQSVFKEDAPQQAVVNQPGGGLPPGFTVDQPSDMSTLGFGSLDPSIAAVQELFTGAQRQTPETIALPEIGELQLDDPAQAAEIAVGFLSTVDPQARREILTNAIPEAAFRTDEKGNEFVKVGEQEFVMNKPGFSATDARNAVAQIVSFIPAARLAGLGRSVLQKVGLGGAASAATETGLQATAQATGAEGGFDPTRIALAGGLGAGAEVLGPTAGLLKRKAGDVLDFFADVGTAVTQGKPLAQVRQARQAVSALPAEEAAVATQAVTEAQAAAEATGVPLFQAQQTTIPAQVEKQAFLAQLPGSTQKASTALKAQNEAAGAAVDDLLAQIAPPEAVVTGAEKFRTASQRAIDAAKQVRSEKASPLFKEAFSEGAAVELQPVKDLIKQSIDDFPKGGEVSNVMKKINGLLAGPTGKKPTLRQLHNAKLEIDQLINRFGENSLGNTTKKQVLEVKDQLLNQMDEASDLYRQARETFAAESPAVTKLQESLIGKIAGIDDTQLKNVSKRIFDAAETNPQVIKQAKKVIDDVDPEAWNQLLRTELERRLGSVRTVEGLSAENVPAQLFNAMFGNTKQRRVLFNSVDGETAKNLKYLETVLSRAKLGRPGGSQTAAREEIKRELRGGTTNAIRNFFRKPIDNLVATGEDAAFNTRVRALADAMFDPQFKPRMKEVRGAGLTTERGSKLLTKLLKDVASCAGDSRKLNGGFPMSNRLKNPVPQFFDNDGSVLDGAQLFTYKSGTSTLKDTFADPDEKIKNTNPIICPAGRVPNTFFSGTAKQVLLRANDSQVWERDPVGGEATDSAFGDWDSVTSYSETDIVRGSDNEYYISLINSNQGNDPTSTPAAWSQLVLVRVWNTNETYDINDTVRGSDGKLYRGLTATNQGNDPTASPSNWVSSIDDADGAVSTSNLADGAVTDDKLASTVKVSNLLVSNWFTRTTPTSQNLNDIATGGG